MFETHYTHRPLRYFLESCDVPIFDEAGRETGYHCDVYAVFDSPEEAHAWAAIELEGFPYDLQQASCDARNLLPAFHLDDYPDF